jgi:hypothetical protein
VVPGDYVVGALTAPTTLPNALIDEFTQLMAEGGGGVAAFYGRLNAAGLPFPGVMGVRLGAMTVTPSRPGWIAPPLTTSDGRLRAYPTTFHPSALSAATAAIVTVRSGEEKPGINIQVTPRPLLRVSGRVLGADGPMPGVVVRLITIDPATTMSSPPSQIDEAVAMTGADGTFLFPGVAPGQYRIRMLQAPPPQNRNLPLDAPTWWAIQEVNVGNDDIDGLDITARRGARFKGRVVFEGTPTPADVDALRNVTVFPRAVPGTIGSLALVTAGVGTPSATGEYSSAEFVPGPYVLEALNLPRGWIVKSVMAGGQDAADVPVELPEGGLDNIVVTLTDKISSVVGQVRGSNDKAAVNSTVGVFPVDRAMWRRVGMQSRRTQTFIPRRDGLFLITGLPPGEYYIVATEGEVPDFSDPVVLTSLIPSAVSITIVPGEQKIVGCAVGNPQMTRALAILAVAAIAQAGQVPGRDRVVPPATGSAAIAGSVVGDDTERTPLRRVTLTLVRAGFDARVTSTDDKGRYLFSGLPAGIYTLNATKARTFPRATDPPASGCLEVRFRSPMRRRSARHLS